MLETAVLGHVNVNISKSICRIFTRLTPMHYGAVMNASHFGFKRSKFKVTVDLYCWKHYGQRHVVLSALVLSYSV